MTIGNSLYINKSYIVYIICITGIMLSVFIAYYAHQIISQQVKNDFGNISTQYSRYIKNNLNIVSHDMNVMALFYASSDGIDALEFANFSAGLTVLHSFVKSSYFLAYRGGKELPVEYVAPYEENKHLLNVNFGAIYYEDFNQAVQLNKIMIIQKIKLPEVAFNKHNILVIKPVYRQVLENNLDNNRWQNLEGFVILEVDIAQMINIISHEAMDLSNLYVNITDVTKENSSDIVYSNSILSDNAIERSKLLAIDYLHIGQKKWRIAFFPHNGKYLLNIDWRVFFIFFVGIIVTCLITLHFLFLQYKSKLYNSLKSAEAKIKDSEQRIRSVLDNTVDGIITISGDGNIQSFNLACEKLFGYTANEAIGKSVNILTPTQGANKYQAQTANYIKTGKKTIIGKRKNGEEFFLDLAINQIIIDEKTMFTGILRDISKEKRDEDELRKHRDHLQELVDEQVKDIVQAKEEAEYANQLKTDFLSNMSHELRTPMHAIISFSKLNIEMVKSGDAAKADRLQNLQIIKDSGERLLNLLNNLLDLSKLESGVSEFCIKSDKIRKTIDKAVSELYALLYEKNLSVNIIEGSNLPKKIDHDSVKIIQVIINLLSNAIKFSPNDNKIEILIENAYLNLNNKENTAIAVTVIDHGIGVPNGELETVFDKFIQSSKTKTGAGGTGLGLAICKEIIEVHNGIINASSDKSGTKFKFIIPVTQPE